MYQVFSDLGGQLGLWVGISVLTFADLIQQSLQKLVRTRNRISKNSAKKRRNELYNSSTAITELDNCFAENCFCNRKELRCGKKLLEILILYF